MRYIVTYEIHKLKELVPVSTKTAIMSALDLVTLLETAEDSQNYTGVKIVVIFAMEVSEEENLPPTERKTFDQRIEELRKEKASK